ncbi:3D domain-containing protein [Flagellimonas meishanensis]|uniref:3D domain-containing protein n=1 Tax=Flagellimonas meishanensis TaxID=2873264 RepID=UPI00223C1FBB|nr:3D domain-containing protein [[Muricauda] meishanensis]
MKKEYLLLALFVSCAQPKKVDNFEWIGLEVTASAYNSVAWQTDSISPSVAAWGDTLKPGMKSIAVSRDLIRRGLTHNTMVKIDTFPDTFYVKDKMHYRWRNRIDIYMGVDVKKARQWGKKKLFICYAIPKDTTFVENKTK